MMRTSLSAAAALLVSAAALTGCGPSGDGEHPGVSSSSSSGGGSSNGGTASSSGGPECSPVLCDIYCPYGHALDAAGCESCSCNPAPTCDGIFDEAQCRNADGCVVVYFDEEGQPVRDDPTEDQARPAPPPDDYVPFQCCTEQPDGSVICGGTPPPPTSCYSDSDCGRGSHCEFTSCGGCGGTEPADGEGGAPAPDCFVACEGQCVPDQDPCFGAWLDENGLCRGPTDGVAPAYCCEVPSDTCYSDSECRADQFCSMDHCYETCDDGADPTDGQSDVVCRVACEGRCLPREEPPPTCYSDFDCPAGQVCEYTLDCGCGTSPDGQQDPVCLIACLGQCVPSEPPPPVGCFTDADCAAGEMCEITSDCGCGGEPGPDGQQDPVCLIACQGQCVPSEPPPPPPAECYADSDCAAGEICQFTTDCGCGVPSDGDESGRAACLIACAGQCVPSEPPPPPAECYADSDCGAGELCEIASECTTTCLAPAPGDDGDAAPCFVQCAGVCVPAEEPVTSCYSDNDCSGGLVCDTVNYCDSACDGQEDPTVGCPAVCLGRCVPPADPCASLSEGECILDHDLCSPVYAEECTEWSDGTRDCASHYAGCVNMGG